MQTGPLRHSSHTRTPQSSKSTLSCCHALPARAHEVILPRQGANSSFSVSSLNCFLEKGPTILSSSFNVDSLVKNFTLSWHAARMEFTEDRAEAASTQYPTRDYTQIRHTESSMHTRDTGCKLLHCVSLNRSNHFVLDEVTCIGWVYDFVISPVYRFTKWWHNALSVCSFTLRSSMRAFVGPSHLSSPTPCAT